MSKEKSLWQQVQECVYAYPTESSFGFSPDEVEKIVSEYPGINIDRFNDALNGITCMSVDGIVRIYHCDIEKAIMCGIQNRGLLLSEWD